MVEKVPTPPPQEGTLQSFMTFCQELSKKVQELPDVNFPVNESQQQQQQQQAVTAHPYNVGMASKQGGYYPSWPDCFFSFSVGVALFPTPTDKEKTVWPREAIVDPYPEFCGHCIV